MAYVKRKHASSTARVEEGKHSCARPPAPGLTSLQYLDRRLFVQLNGSRKVIGVLRGYDVFLNIVLDDAVEEKAGGEKVRIGQVVIRGNSVVMLEALERMDEHDRR
ncbi:hypothetical protein E4T48_04850 [Aureobasidium sp. EXF-10727]|nr:hypothetical protein E4T48_04850 [Aureobasidium sp. EXF-10727]